MFADGTIRKRKSSGSHDDCCYEPGSPHSQHLRLRIVDNDRDGARASSSHSNPPPSSAAPVKRSRGLKTNPSRHDEDGSTSTLSSGPEKRKGFTFFSFPGELRNMIYDYSLHYPDSRRLYAQYYRYPAINKTSSKWDPRLRAPTILLLNKRITKECLPVLKSTKLVIDRLPPPRICDIHNTLFEFSCGYPRPSFFLRLSDFIRPQTLQNIPQIDINVGLCEGPLGSGWAWTRVVDELLAILTQRNACAKLRLLFRLCNIDDYPSVWQSDRNYQALMIRQIDKFANFNPNVFAQREIKIEVWRIEGQKATYIEEQSYPRPPWNWDDEEPFENVSLEHALLKNGPNPAPRMYPDREMFPGSVMEFVRPAPPPFYSDDDWDG